MRYQEKYKKNNQETLELNRTLGPKTKLRLQLIGTKQLSLSITYALSLSICWTVLMLGLLTVMILGGSDERQQMTGRDDVTDCCVHNVALSWLGASLCYQEKYEKAVKIYQETLELNQTFVPIIKLRLQQIGIGKKQLSLSITYELFFVYLFILSSLCRFLNE